VLDFHVRYACRHTGVCCSSGWDIPVDDQAGRVLHQAMTAGILGAAQPAAGAAAGAALIHGPDLPDGAAALLARSDSGDCVFLDRHAGNLCRIHGCLGPAAKPASCRHFPWVARFDDDGVRATLSHYCPTAAGLLFEGGPARIEVVPAPGELAASLVEGFDARGAVPPFLRPGVVFDPDSRAIWDRFVLDTCSRDGWAPELVLDTLAAVADRVSAWTPAEGPLAAHVHNQSRVDFVAGPASDCTSQSGIGLEAVAAAVPKGLPRPLLPVSFEAADARWLAPVWASFAAPLRRYVAARAFGAWAAYQADGLRTEVAVLRAALSVVRVEAVRQAAAAAAPLNAAMLQRAIQAADLLTVHQSDGLAVVRFFGRRGRA
jgi:Fe-S-cluster containining protein